MADRRASYNNTWKRLFDLLSALLGIIVLSPGLLVIALIVKAGSSGPVIYRQERIGRDFRPFVIYKFRTMRPGADADGNTCTITGDPRVTAAGRWLRRSKVDELPQLFNVLKGDMSLVGPRPEVARFVEMFKDDYKVVLGVRPGITDYAAIAYSDEEEALARYPDPEKAYVTRILPAKIALYRKYIAGQSFRTDFGIILATLWKLTGRKMAAAVMHF